MSPFLRPDAPSINDMLADGAVALLEERGIAAVNVAALARWMGVTKQTLSERLWDPDGPRRRIIRLTVLAFANRWLDWVDSALLGDPPVPALPRSEEEVHGVRVWAALTELARGERVSGNPDPAAGIVATLEQERDAVRLRLKRWIGVDPSEDEVVELCALADGLRAALVQPTTRLSSDDAQRILRRRLLAIRSAATSRGGGVEGVLDGAGPGPA